MLIQLKAIEEGILLLKMMAEQLRVVIMGVGVVESVASIECVIIIFIRGIPSFTCLTKWIATVHFLLINIFDFTFHNCAYYITS